MSKKNIIKNNLLLLIGGNLGNVFSFLIHLLLLRLDPLVANTYLAYNGIVLILGVPALVVMRMLTIYGYSTILKLKNFYSQHRTLSNAFLILLFLSLILLNLIIQRMTFDQSPITAFMILTLAIATFFSYAFRGLKQHQENFLPTIISLNVETGGRLLLVYIFCFLLGWGINGVLIGSILSMILSIIPVFEFKNLQMKNLEVDTDDYSFLKALITSLSVTACIEFFSNFDIVYSINSLQYDINAQTQYNILQVFRKIVFYSIFISSGLILSIGGKKKHSKVFTFLYTLISSMVIGIVSSIVLYISKDIVLAILNSKLDLIDYFELIVFLFFTTLMSSSYLLSNWLLSRKKLVYTLIPVFAVIGQIFVYVSSNKNLDDLLKAYFISSGIFFMLTFFAGLYESVKQKHVI